MRCPDDVLSLIFFTHSPGRDGRGPAGRDRCNFEHAEGTPNSRTMSLHATEKVSNKTLERFEHTHTVQTLLQCYEDEYAYACTHVHSRQEQTRPICENSKSLSEVWAVRMI